MLRRFYSTKPSPLKSAICIVGQNAISVNRTVQPEVDIQTLIQHGPKPLKDNLEARNICPKQLLGSSIGNNKMKI